MSVILAIDPGREKCGVAVVSRDGVLHKGIVPASDIPEVVPVLVATYHPSRILVGAGTNGRALASALRAKPNSPPVELVDERLSSLRARTRFFQENPPKGIRRLIPRGLLVPDRPWDDYAAVILAEEYLNRT